MSWHLYPVSAFPSLRNAWAELSDRCGGSPLLHPDFVLLLLQCFGTGEEIIAVYGGLGGLGGVQAAGVFCRKAFGAIWETFQPSQAPLGAWLSSADAPLEPLLSALSRKLPGVPLVIGVTQQDPDLTARPSDVGCVQTLDYIRTARITVSGSFDDYWARRGKNLRHNLNRQRNGLKKRGIETHLKTLTRPEEMRDAIAIEAYGRLESAGWKNTAGTAVHAGNSQGRFYRELLERFARSNDARVYQYWYNEDLVATDLCIQRNGTLVILKTTFDETRASSSPAQLMRQEAFREIFAEGRVRRIEFYGRLMDWHTKWSEEIRTLYHVSRYRWPSLFRLLRRMPPLARLRAAG